MKSRLVNLDEDYDMLCEWWGAHGWDSPVPTHALPKLGVVITDDNDNPLSAGFLYSCVGTSFGLIEWVVSNPEASPRMIYKSIMVLLEQLKELAFKVGSTTLGASLHNEGLIKMYERNGFKASDLTMTNLIFNLGE